MLRIPPLGLALCTGLLLASVAPGQTTTWQGSVSSSWSEAANWENGVPDQNLDAVVLPSPNDPSVTAAAACRSLTVHPGATLQVAGPQPLSVHDNCLVNGVVTGPLHFLGTGTHGVTATDAASTAELRFAGPGSFTLSWPAAGKKTRR